MRFSEVFITRLKMNEIPVYKLSTAVGYPPLKLYRLMSGLQRINPEDGRLIKLAQLIGVRPSQIFEK